MRHAVASSLIVLAFVTPVLSEEVVREISWGALKKAGQLPVGELQVGQSPGPSEQLKIDNPDDRLRTFTLLVVDDPGVAGPAYAVTGRVRCEGVQGEGYLEMWSHFAGGGHCFSRTLASSGLLQNLEGSCPWRPFSLPLILTPSTDRPQSLVINVVLPGRGTVYLSPLRLVQYAEGEAPLAVPGQWWDDRTGGLIGGIGGSIIGCLGGLIGTLAGMGRARRFVLGLTKALFLVGLVLIGVGLVAVVQSQPYGVYYPLLLAGVISAAVCGGLLRTLRRRYDELELRKMSALDAV